MDVNNGNDEKTECDSMTALELEKSKRILYFSDGIMEDPTESEEEDISPDIADRPMNFNISVTSIPLGSRIKYHAFQIGSLLFNGVEYVGESLASFFGITTPKYVSESEIERVTKSEPQTHDLDIISHSNNDGACWHHNNNINGSNVVITRFLPNSKNNSL